jgi:hypothetical protein
VERWQAADVSRTGLLVQRGAAVTTRFVKCNSPIPGGVTVRVYQDADTLLGDVISPAVEGSHTAADADRDGELGVHQALASAIEIAGKHGDVVGIMDENGHWKDEWGTLEQA